MRVRDPSPGKRQKSTFVAGSQVRSKRKETPSASGCRCAAGARRLRRSDLVFAALANEAKSFSVWHGRLAWAGRKSSERVARVFRHGTTFRHDRELVLADAPCTSRTLGEDAALALDASRQRFKGMQALLSARISSDAKGGNLATDGNRHCREGRIAT